MQVEASSKRELSDLLAAHDKLQVNALLRLYSRSIKALLRLYYA